MNDSTPPTVIEIAPADRDPQTRNRLLESAVQIFDRKGYSAASVREIAEMAGVTKPALYYHFGSKERLLVAILDEAAREFTAAVANGVARPGTARERLVALCEDVFNLSGEKIPLLRVAHTVFLGPVDIAPAFDVTTFERPWREALQRVIEDGQASGEFRQVPSIDVAYAIMGLVESSVDRQMHPGFDSVGRDGLRKILSLLFDGVAREQRQ